MTKSILNIFAIIFFDVIVIPFQGIAQNSIIQRNYTIDSIMLPPIPDVPASLEPDTVPMGDWKSFPEVKIDIPVTPGPFEPTWESIEKNYPGEPAWLREAKFGIWIHFARNPQERVAIGMHAGSIRKALWLTRIILKNMVIRPKSVTRKSCVIGIPLSLIPPHSRRYIKMQALDSL